MVLTPGTRIRLLFISSLPANETLISSQNTGASFKGIQVAGVQISRKPFLADTPTKPLFKPMLLADYLKQPLIKQSGIEIYPKEIISFVRNKLGSVHYDPSRNPSKARDKKFIILDTVQKQSKLREQDPVWIELLGIGQAITKSQYIRRLERKIQKLLK